eukprot:g11070.t1
MRRLQRRSQKQDVLADLDAFGFPRDYAVRCLQLNKHNHVTTTYYLLSEKKRRLMERLKKLSTGELGIIEACDLAPGGDAAAGTASSSAVAKLAPQSWPVTRNLQIFGVFAGPLQLLWFNNPTASSSARKPHRFYLRVLVFLRCWGHCPTTSSSRRAQVWLSTSASKNDTKDTTKHWNQLDKSTCQPRQCCYFAGAPGQCSALLP